ncbi:MAG: hypothetical protein GC190_15755 [Alphaproteobacteria bacterium]|nr:hypothetical protein [Alphaproteobacteria bacterium]
MRTLAFMIVLAEVLILGPLMLLYGQVDPCRALAAEMANREGPTSLVGDIINGDPEVAARRDIADLSTGQCYVRIYQSWIHRITG